MAASAECCSQCGKQGVEFKRCSRCKQACYCGRECQKVDWKRHKKDCDPSVGEKPHVCATGTHCVMDKLLKGHAERDWRGVLQLEGLMEEIMEDQSDEDCSKILWFFLVAHHTGVEATGCKDHAISFVALQKRRIPLLGKLQRFQDQGVAMCKLAEFLRPLSRKSEAVTWYQRARDVGAAHGFFSLESKACMGLGNMATQEGRHEEGVALPGPRRNALVAAELNELDDPAFELEALKALIYALFITNSIDEVEPLVLRYRVAAKACLEKQGGGSTVHVHQELAPSQELATSLLYSARLNEVLCICTPR